MWGAEIGSAALGLRLEFDGQRLRFWDPVRRRYLLTPVEEAEARRQAEQVAREEAQVRREAERRAQVAAARIAELEAALKSAQGER